MSNYPAWLDTVSRSDLDGLPCHRQQSSAATNAANSVTSGAGLRSNTERPIEEQQGGSEWTGGVGWLVSSTCETAQWWEIIYSFASMETG